MLYDKEKIYDDEISPLMAKIIEICKRENIPMAAQFYLKEQDDEGLPMYCTTFMVPSKDEIKSEVHEHLRGITDLMKYGKNGKPLTISMAITKKEG